MKPILSLAKSVRALSQNSIFPFKSGFPQTRNGYISKSFQARLIVKFLLILTFGGIITIGLTLFITRGSSLTTSFVNSRLVIQDTSIAILPAVIYASLITLSIIAIIAVLVILLDFHKIARPVDQFEINNNCISEDDFKYQINLSQEALFQELVPSLNEMIGSILENPDLDICQSNGYQSQEMDDKINLSK